jgi:hypothetical protein
VGRQRTMGEFFKRGSAEDKTEARVQAYKELAKDDELVHQYARQNLGGCHDRKAVVGYANGSVTMEVASKNGFAALTHDDQSWGNTELDAREQLDTNELLARLRLAKEMRSKKVCMQDTPEKRVWDTTAHNKCTLAEEFDMQESDSSDDASEMPELVSRAVMLDESHSGSDSEYWAAVEDSDLSDASIVTEGSSASEEEETESEQDFC